MAEENASSPHLLLSSGSHSRACETDGGKKDVCSRRICLAWKHTFTCESYFTNRPRRDASGTVKGDYRSQESSTASLRSTWTQGVTNDREESIVQRPLAERLPGPIFRLREQRGAFFLGVARTCDDRALAVGSSLQQCSLSVIAGIMPRFLLVNDRGLYPYFHGPNSTTESLSRSNCRLTFVSGRQRRQSRFVLMNTSLADSAYLATISSLKCLLFSKLCNFGQTRKAPTS